MEFLDKNLLAASGFYYTNYKDVVCCAFCHVRLGQWKQEDSPFEEHKRWSPACAFINGLFVGNKPVGSNNEQYGRSRDVCGSSNCKYLCLYLFFYMYVFLIALQTNFHCVLYSYRAKKKKNPVGGVLHSFPSMTRSKLECRHLPNGHCLSHPCRKLDFSTRVNISLYIVFCT